MDRLFSEYVRRRDADAGGTVRCVTCPRLMFWRDSHAGHFIKRQHRSVRWDERNVAPQCPADNVYKGGCQDEFAAHIIKTHGPEVFDELMAKKHQVCKHTRADLEDLIDTYKRKLNDLDSPVRTAQGCMENQKGGQDRSSGVGQEKDEALATEQEG